MSASSAAGAPQLTGLFQTEEKCIVFLDIVQELINATLMDAYRSAANMKMHEMPSVMHFPPYIAERYRYALDLIPNWPYQILQQEEERALQRCNAIHDCYRYLVEAYAKNLTLASSQPSQHPNYALPPLPAFLHDIYNEFICIPEVRNGVYFQMYGIHRKNTIADAIRAALRKLVSKLMDQQQHGHMAAAGPYLSPGPSISQRPPQIFSPVPPPPPPPLTQPSVARVLPPLPPTPKTQRSSQVPRLPPTPPITQKTTNNNNNNNNKSPSLFQKAIEVDMKAIDPPTPKQQEDSEPSSASDSENDE